MSETIKRSIAKTLSWRTIAITITFIITFVIFGNLQLAAAVGLVDTLVKMFIYFIHERIWNKFSYGIMK